MRRLLLLLLLLATRSLWLGDFRVYATQVRLLAGSPIQACSSYSNRVAQGDFWSTVAVVDSDRGTRFMAPLLVRILLVRSAAALWSWIVCVFTLLTHSSDWSQ